MVFRLDSSKMINISMAIREDMKTYKNRPEKKPLIKGSVREDPSYLSESTIKMNLHTGSHIDFPRHISSDGKTSSDYLMSWTYFHDAIVLEVDDEIQKINKDVLSSFDVPEEKVVIFKSSFSKSDSSPIDFPYLTEDGAKYLLDKKVKLVGIDSLGIERNQAMHQTHHLLLSNDILIMEGLELSKVSTGEFTLFISPVPILDVEAVPITAYLFKK
ncbi:MAG: cyclase family protein [Firmicutes bacterium]|nr:cyclase family protein [Bacillota bacterium]